MPLSRTDVQTNTLLFKRRRALYGSGHSEHVTSLDQWHHRTEFMISLALLPIYEFVITFDQEVASVWASSKKLSFGSLLLVSTRWCMVLAALMVCLPDTMTVRITASCYHNTSRYYSAAEVCMVRFRVKSFA